MCLYKKIPFRRRDSLIFSGWEGSDSLIFSGLEGVDSLIFSGDVSCPESLYVL